MTRRTVVFLLWLAAITSAAAFDRPVAEWVRAKGLEGGPQAHRAWSANHRRANAALKLPGEYYVTLGAAVALGLLHPLRWRAAGFVALSGAASGVNGLLKWVVGRYRPV